MKTHLEFCPTVRSDNYYELLNADKKYVRFKESKHVDFTSLPSVLNDSGVAAETHKQIIEIARQFFIHQLKGGGTFNVFWENLIKQDNILTDRFGYQTDNLNFKENTFKAKIIDSKTKSPLNYSKSSRNKNVKNQS